MKTIRVFAREVTFEQNGKKKKFYPLSFTKDGQTFYNVKITQDTVADCGVTLPQEQGYYKLTLDPENVSIQTFKAQEDGYVPNPTMWVHGTDGVTLVRDTEYDEERKAKELEIVNGLIGE